MADVRILQERQALNEKREVHIFNPTSQTFSVDFRSIPYVVLPETEIKLPYYVAELFVRKIVDYMVNKKDRIVSPSEREDFAKRVRLYEPDPVD